MKLRKSIVCHNYSKFVNPTSYYDFGDQRSYRANIKFPKRNKDFFYDIMVHEDKSDYSRHSFYPGQKVWIIRLDRRTGQISVDYDHICEMYAFGEIGSGALFHYWLRSYGTGHGIDAGDLYLTKQAALNGITQFNTYIRERW